MSLKQSFDLTDEGDLQDYLGTRLTKHPDGRIELQQKKTIDNWLELLGLGPTSKNVKTHDPWQNHRRFFMTMKMGQTGSTHGTTGRLLDALTTCKK